MFICVYLWPILLVFPLGRVHRRDRNARVGTCAWMSAGAARKSGRPRHLVRLKTATLRPFSIFIDLKLSDLVQRIGNSPAVEVLSMNTWKNLEASVVSGKCARHKTKCYPARNTVHTLAQMGPPILNVAATFGARTCNSAGASPCN